MRVLDGLPSRTLFPPPASTRRLNKYNRHVHVFLYHVFHNDPKREIFLQEVRDRNTHPLPKKKQKKITASFESIEIENSKVKRINHALTRLFVCCGIPFSIVSNPFFIDFVKSLCLAYELLNRVIFAGSWVNQELATVTTIIYDEAQSSTNITLGIDGWAGPNGQSIYAFILILPTGKEYIYSLKISHYTPYG